ncbi:hypothetical protein D0962_13615 [Leptolyngbyaceae cyanobacterium CCMR0082]|uniref:Uncharacterized protein n=2 Tax=Adonisia turfae TaxID=2950184 RepID=A0A6M0S7L1_9CYAN|nr:hypothetical protein [Adonisia turfae]MDV3353545.1 hypothetical protein [Leptothoe sp. LEGE 181152]NEZ56803.1 hypothetical protein [Adonisia turfae CCMR0081]NEZ63812.1 hypothetical protein [Adonisia turfae CCMR0082]
MTLLDRFLKLLEFLEAAQEVFEFLTTPTGLSGVLAICLYFPMQALGCDASAAATLACTAALTFFCLIEKPDF